MGLKTNKSTKTSQLDCQYVGSFPVKDRSGRKLVTREQNSFVEEKLKACQKKMITGMSVILEVSPDGIRVLNTDGKTVKMGHSLRRVSYVTAEATNKLFAYVSHQPGTEMDIVCHTFQTKKKDHAESLSAALGKLFKQTFAYTLKRRDKLEEAAEKRGANRKWAKQQVATAHMDSGRPRNQRAPPPAKGTTGTHNDPGAPRGGSSTATQPPPAANMNTNETAQTIPKTNEVVVVSQVHTSRPLSTSGRPPPLPERNGPAAFRKLSEGGRAPAQVSSEGVPTPFTENNEDVFPPPLPNRNGTSGPPTTNITRSPQQHMFTPPSPDPFVPPSPPHTALRNQRQSSSDSVTEVVSPIWLKPSTPSGAGVIEDPENDAGPPPLPQRPWESFDEEPGASFAQNQAEATAGDNEWQMPDEDSIPTKRRVSMTLEDEDWYIPGVTRDYVTEMLETSDMGTFFVRDSQSVLWCYALTMKVLQNPNNPTGFGHYLIMPTSNGFTLQGFDKDFPDISTLIRHYASYEDGLPCKLLLAGSNPLFHDANGYLVEFMDEEDDAYASISNCSSMFQELKLNGASVPW